MTKKPLGATIILAAALCFLLATGSFAFDSSFPNNKFGIHLAVPQKEDINKAAELVNSSGGKWGYVTLVVQENDRDSGKWQGIFNQLRKLHLIPIVRLATVAQGQVWKRPVSQEADGWASFLASLNWPVKDRYVILFNEPNHAAEWGGTVDATNYAEIAAAFSQKLKDKNGNFFVMLAGFDASASSSSLSQDEGAFLSQMNSSTPDLFDRINGWSSHSYPNPGFAGSPNASGRGTVRGYEWELGYLRSIGITKDLPVFITETGWSNEALSPDQIGQNLSSAFNLWLADSRVRAATPFVLNYQGEPFLKFSWQKHSSADFYPQYEVVKNLPKISGSPEQQEQGLVTLNFPKELLTDSNYHFFIPIKNQGQTIWSRKDGYHLKLQTDALQTYSLSDIGDIEPQESDAINLFLKTKKDVGAATATVALYKNDKKIIDGGLWSFDILPLPILSFEVKTFPGGGAQGDNFQLQIFDQNNQLVFEKKNIRVSGGKATLEGINNVFLGGDYRLVLLAPYYLPRQESVTFHKQGNFVHFKVLLPLDFNQDGRFDWGDFEALIKNPKLLRLY